jgi:peptidoglycan/xylan/chitin deacetylase (PgdA/CDA1 family)
VTATLLYHDVVARDEQDGAGFAGPLAARYKLEPGEFEAHLDAIAALGRRVGTLDRADPPEVALTFDDAGASALAVAAALERRGWRGHFFVPTALMSRPGFLARDEVVTLAERGHVVGSHSHTHPTYMARLPRADLEQEWTVSRELLGELLGTAPTTASVPGGMFSRVVAETAAAAGYEILMTSEPVAGFREANGLLMVGRYSIWSTTPAARAAAYARGARWPRARLWLEWRAKAATKRISPGLYQRFRHVRAGTP